jgi:acyl carrier protein
MVELMIREWIEEKNSSSNRIDGDLFIDFGLDSLQFAELISHLERRLQMEIDFSEVIDWENVKRLSGLVKFIERGLSK